MSVRNLPPSVVALKSALCRYNESSFAEDEEAFEAIETLLRAYSRGAQDIDPENPGEFRVLENTASALLAACTALVNAQNGDLSRLRSMMPDIIDYLSTVIQPLPEHSDVRQLCEKQTKQYQAQMEAIPPRAFDRSFTYIHRLERRVEGFTKIDELAEFLQPLMDKIAAEEASIDTKQTLYRKRLSAAVNEVYTKLGQLFLSYYRPGKSDKGERDKANIDYTLGIMDTFCEKVLTLQGIEPKLKKTFRQHKKDISHARTSLDTPDRNWSILIILGGLICLTLSILYFYQ